MNQQENRIIILERALKDSTRALRDALERIKRLEDRAKVGGEGGGGGGGSVPGVFYADHLNIAAHSTGTATVYEAWTGSVGGTGVTVRNVLPDATTNTKRQLLGKSPDGSYVVIAESCSDQ